MRSGFYSAMLIGFAGAALFFPALRLPAAARLVVLAVLASGVLIAPFLVPPEYRMARFASSLFASLMVFKMWALHCAARTGDRPNAREMAGYLVNVFFLVWSRRGQERQPDRKHVFKHAGITLITALVLAELSGAVIRLPWTPSAFLLQHTLITIGMMAFVIAWMSLMVDVTRLLGGYMVNAHDHPWLATTPADWWRRYNRIIGTFLHECVFKPVGGRRHPVRGTLAAFAVSGVLHEYIFWLSTGRSAGLQMAFFMLQGLAVVATMRVRPRGAAVWGWRLATFVFMALSSVIFMASMHYTIPIYNNGVPGWLAGY